MSDSPLIGISAYEMSVDFSHWPGVRSVLVPASYVHAVDAAGGRPIVLPPLAEPLTDVLALLDALVVTGGPDLDPGLYGAERHPAAGDFDGVRDRAEAALLREALARDLPFLGVCRGMQLLNVVRGGTLDQHLPDVVGDEVAHKAPAQFLRHEVDALAGSRLERILGARLAVHSSHHQAPAEVGRGLRVGARAADGTVEAIEDPSRRFALGVLWHPEEDPEEGAPLFRELVAAARDYREKREAA